MAQARFPFRLARTSKINEREEELLRMLEDGMLELGGVGQRNQPQLGKGHGDLRAARISRNSLTTLIRDLHLHNVINGP
jgi:hypothetical protein